MSCGFHIHGIIIAIIIPQVENQEAANSGNSSPCPYNQVKKINNSCEDCPIGTFGLNCKNGCLPGYYGELCRYTCNCTDQNCDSIYGCVDPVVTSTYINNLINEIISESEENESNINFTRVLQNNKNHDHEHHISHSWIHLNFIIIGFLCAVVIIGILAFLRSRIKKRKFQPGAKTDIINRNATQRLNAQTPRFQLNHVDSTYDELRCSKMIENIPKGMRGGKMFSEKNSPNVIENLEGACGRKLFQKNEKFQNKGKEKFNCDDYEHCSSENGYSVLSLKFYRSKRNFTRPAIEVYKGETSPPKLFSTEEQYVLLKDRGNDSGSVTYNNPENDTLLDHNPPEKKSYLERYSLVKNYICKNEDISIAIPEESYDINNLKSSINGNDHTLDVKNLNSDTIASRTRVYSNAHLIGCEVEDIVMQETNDNTTNNLKDDVLPRPYSLANV